MVNTQICVFLFLSVSNVRALPDGLHPTPPMGWTSWNTFFEENSQDKMISQVRSQGVWRLALLILCPDWCLVRAWAWQVWLHLPDHWWLLAAAWEGPRHSEDGGRSIEVSVILKSNVEWKTKVRFPDGIKFISDYIHSQGLSIGIYSSAGRYTCSGLRWK